ncbi:hypothetical protein EPA93_34375 [Ktedonosporobacter rubrisoli]|uniref:HTH luxR-type domain-containing protein n=1 Tax=Ktedonosporobacter rubrisoli TaxID=2509675 RepID=A0A4P6JZ57_KTERU|nr:LuxR C-terminal-related transcriptional regulator [Ktedonosporobacter rubrisoli]QBD80782.1 hypothetical protein EPA93_34375 [Ktedonosporobacter rubrisoli]
MARRAIARVISNQLWRLDATGNELAPIEVGAHDWYAWLEAQEASSFAYRTPYGAMTVRRESRQGGWYWYAYRLQGTRLRKVYLGKAGELTPQRLSQAITKLTDKPALTPAEQLTREPQDIALPARGLLKTRLSLPPCPAHLVSRQRLWQALYDGSSRHLTLLYAPAGYGKTTLLSEWVRYNNLPVVWLTLAEEDNEPLRFLTYLLAALQARYAQLGADILNGPLLWQQSSLFEALTEMLNELEGLSEDVLIILDNYHVIESQLVQEAIKFMLDHLPTRVHIILSTRYKPPFSLARLYMHGQVAELRANQLRFTQEEMQAFFRQGSHELTSVNLDCVNQNIEGWAVGLQLALQTARKPGAAPRSLVDLVKNNRYFQDYLVEEVLDYLPEHIRDFLLYTVSLEHFNGSLCRALTGQIEAQQILEQLDHENLFIVALPEQPGWYRYQRLFATALRHYLQQNQPDLIPEIHKRASDWFAEQGFTREAIEHSLSAQDLERAAGLIEQMIHPLLEEGEIETLQRWLTKLPDHILSASPLLCIASAWLIFLTTQALQDFAIWLDTAEESILAQEEQLSPATVASLRGEIIALRTIHKVAYNDFAYAAAACSQILSILPEDKAYARNFVSFALALAYQRGISVSTAWQMWAQVNSDNQVADHALLGPYILQLQAELYAVQGQPFEALKRYQRILSLVKRENIHPAGVICFRVGMLFWDWNNQETARQYLLQAWDIGQQADSSVVMLNSATCLAQIAQIQGRTDEADRWLKHTDVCFQSAGKFEVIDLQAALYAWIELQRGHLDEALLWAQKRVRAGEEASQLNAEEVDLTMAQILVQACHEQADNAVLVQQATDTIERLRTNAETVGKIYDLIIILGLQALLLYSQDKIEDALSVLERSVLLAEPGRYIRLFIDMGEAMEKLLRLLRERYKTVKATERPINLAYVRRLLEAFVQPVPHTRLITTGEERILLDPLSSRELEVLRLLAIGKKNQEIARELVIVTGTVKAHINSIYRKLSVNSRVQAIARARALNLL